MQNRARAFRTIPVLAAALAVAGVRQAQGFPLPGTTGDRTALEDTAPFLLPAGFAQRRLADRVGLTARGLPASLGNWDMVAFGPRSRFVFVPAEVASAAGVFRYDTLTGDFEVLLLGAGGGTGARTSDPALFDGLDEEYVRLDPATRTPWGSVLTAEEASGGRLFELLDAAAPAAPFARLGRSRSAPALEASTPAAPRPSVRWRHRIPAVAHEGLRLDASGALYFVDESNSGSLYRFVPERPGRLATGRTSVLSADAFAAAIGSGASAAAAWDAPANRPFDGARFGAATWVPMTDAAGNALTQADPFAFVTATGGRAAADELGGTPYGRPEDLAVGVLANGHEVLYCSLTSENRVLSVELVDATSAIVRVFVDFDTPNLFTGQDVNPAQADPYTDPGPDGETNFDDPDNLAVGGGGEVFVLEDEDPGDVWMALDADRDGVAEAVGLWASLGVAGSEPTGLIVDPNDPERFVLCIQHPASGNDALWEVRTDGSPARRFLHR